jgi:hypothetical protein
MQLEDVGVFATGLHFPEGPMAMSDGSVIAVEIYGGRGHALLPGPNQGHRG